MLAMECILWLAQNGEQSKSHREESPSDESDSDFDLDEPEGYLIFAMEAPSTNRLVIPFVLASAHFPAVATTEDQPKKNQYKTLQFTDFHHQDWDMKIEYYRDEHGYILTGWQKFSTQYNLKPMDFIRIYEPVPRLHPHHFLIKVEKKEQRMDPPEFKDENLLFRIKLDQSDIDFNRVFLAGDDVMRNFPGVEIQRHSGKKKIMRFTDAKGKNWYMDIMRYDEKKYMMMEGWDEFAKEKGLEVEDLIRFYKHVDPCHSKHFLIRIAKKRGTGGGPRLGQPGGGSGAGAGAGSSSQSYKGKEIARD
ncbi:hypothetical protein Vadar_000664 [Vaccinium darrowii]|uniref:Uncharacterized protein n=1 Tax=Vaccinium darrowii TaxID=229202 RepID=A0ACB7Z8H8_9ERIC|nr:hypothetical protein Vadar_000664 [Vaccinium darrowii]